MHDHLYNLVASIMISGTVSERYEYDAYGHCTIWDSTRENQRTEPADTINYPNPYLFTGRRIDYLDRDGNGDPRLEIMHYRNRSYDTYTGRFLQHDPLGINPAGGKNKPFAPRKQYKDGMNLYTYCDNSPMLNTDPSGKHFAPPITTPWPIIKPILKVCGLIRLTIAAPCAVGLAAIASTCEIAFSGEDVNHCVCEQLATNSGLRATCGVATAPISWIISPLEYYGDLWYCDDLGYDIGSGETPDSIPVY